MENLPAGYIALSKRSLKKSFLKQNHPNVIAKDEVLKQSQDKPKTSFAVATRDCFTPFVMTKLYFFSNLLKTRLTNTGIWFSLRFKGHYLKTGKSSLIANM
ncbi:hypothetical protein CEE34_04880 [Candidatus Aerophobetes bacterium Ae_b3a]|nr:MAG: hypothetical protein CEE34_04880 [Candidatus Aerophobetes bacterium Ae_b3a]